ncbi:thioredoxin fold domain-containing protein [bacterium]|nr:thioredoxin fold domain-containing protein [bacterium]
MNFNLKEKLQNIDKKNIAIIAGILFAIAICSVCGYEYYQMKKLNGPITQSQEELPDLSENSVVNKENAPDENQNPTMKPSQYNIGIDYDKAIKGNKPIVALFYADWCHYCIKFMPTYQSLSKIYKDDFNFAKVNVEDPKYEKTVREIGITGFPTVFLIDPKYDNRVLLSNAIFGDMKQLRTELDRFLRIRKMLDSKK